MSKTILEKSNSEVRGITEIRQVLLTRLVASIVLLQARYPFSVI